MLQFSLESNSGWKILIDYAIWTQQTKQDIKIVERNMKSSY